jgi:hypothetical protein
VGCPGRPILYLDAVAVEFPELVIVGGHIGYPWTAAMISLETKYPNVYIETSAYKASRYPRRACRLPARARPTQGLVRVQPTRPGPRPTAWTASAAWGLTRRPLKCSCT